MKNIELMLFLLVLLVLNNTYNNLKLTNSNNINDSTKKIKSIKNSNDSIKRTIQAAQTSSIIYCAVGQNEISNKCKCNTEYYKLDSNGNCILNSCSYNQEVQNCLCEKPLQINGINKCSCLNNYIYKEKQGKNYCLRYCSYYDNILETNCTCDINAFEGAGKSSDGVFCTCIKGKFNINDNKCS